MAAATISETPQIDIAAKHTQAQLGKALLDAAQRARQDDRTTYITAGGVKIAAVVPLYVGEAADLDVSHDAMLTGKIVHRPVTGPAIQLELEAASEDD